MNKELSKLISLKNSYLKQNDSEKLDHIRSEIRRLRKEKNQIISTSISDNKKSGEIRFSTDDSNKNFYKRNRRKKENEDEYVSCRKKRNKAKQKDCSSKRTNDYISYYIVPQHKKKSRNINKDDIQVTYFTKRQEELLNEFYLRKISDCTIDDYIEVFSYFIDNNDIDMEALKYYIEYFNDNFISVDNSLLIHKFYKRVNNYIKKYDKNKKRSIKTMYFDVNDLTVDCKNESPIFEILKYFIENNNSTVLFEIIDRYPNITSCYFDNKNIVVNVLEYMLDKYNLIIDNCRCSNPVIQISEDVFIKLYNKNHSFQLQVKSIIDAYVDELKKKNISTVSKNMILYRLSIVNNSLGITPSISMFDDSYNCVYDYYNYEINNVRRRKFFDDSVILNGLPNVSYSISKPDDFYILRINVVDTSIYFVNGTLLNSMLLNNNIDQSKFKDYIRYRNDTYMPSISFEFYYYNGALTTTNICNSIVKTLCDIDLKDKYKILLSKINIDSDNIVSSFDNLIKDLLKNISKNKTPYIVKYKNENDNYRTITDLNHLFSKLNRDELEVIYSILNEFSINYGLSNNKIYTDSYDINLFDSELTPVNVLMKKIIKSYYDSSINISYEDINDSVKAENKILTKH